MANTGARPAPASSRIPLAKIGLGAAALAGLYLLGRTVGAYVPAFAEWVADLGFWGPLVFVAGYAAAVVAFAPASLLTLAAGAVFGLASGTVYVFFAATLGSSLAFLVSRYLARGVVERRLAGNRSFAAIDRAIGREGRKIVLLLRLSPVFPFNLLNYGLGLTGVRFADYVVASLGMLPGTLLYVYLGKVGGELAAAAGGAETGRSSAEWALLSVGLLATAAVTLLVTRIARRALAEATGEEEVSPE
jgi:uncharacterized membrane protein YdjX (TVP38/TMEM64 family)